MEDLHGTSCRLNFVADILAARFATVLKRFYFLSFIPSYNATCLLHFILAYYWPG